MLSKKRNNFGFVDLISLFSVAMLLLTVSVTVREVYKNQNTSIEAGGCTNNPSKCKKTEQCVSGVCKPKSGGSASTGTIEKGVGNSKANCQGFWCAGCGGFCISGATQTCNQAQAIKCPKESNDSPAPPTCNESNAGVIVVNGSGEPDQYYVRCNGKRWIGVGDKDDLSILVKIDEKNVPEYLKEDHKKAVAEKNKADKEAKTEKVETVVVPKPYTTDADQSDKVEPIPSNISLNEAMGNTSGTNPFISAETQEQQQVIEDYLARPQTQQQNLEAKTNVGTKKPNDTNSLCSKDSDCISENCVPLPGGVKACLEPGKNGDEIAKALGYQTTSPDKPSIWDRFRGTQETTEIQTGITAQGGAGGKIVEEESPKTPTIVTNVKNWVSELITPKKVIEKPYTTDSEQVGQIGTTQNPTIGTDVTRPEPINIWQAIPKDDQSIPTKKTNPLTSSAVTTYLTGEKATYNITNPVVGLWNLASNTYSNYLSGEKSVTDTKPTNIWGRASNSLTQFLTGEKTTPTTTTLNPTIGTSAGLNRGEGTLDTSQIALEQYRAGEGRIIDVPVVEKPFWQKVGEVISNTTQNLVTSASNLFNSLSGGSVSSKFGSVIQKSNIGSLFENISGTERENASLNNSTTQKELNLSDQATLFAKDVLENPIDFGIPKSLIDQIYSDGVITENEKRVLFETYYQPSPNVFTGTATNYGAQYVAIATLFFHGDVVRQQMERGWVLDASGQYGYIGDELLQNQSSQLYYQYANQKLDARNQPIPVDYNELNENQKRIYDLTNMSQSEFIRNHMTTIEAQSQLTPEEALNSNQYIDIIATKSVNDLGRRLLLYKKDENGNVVFVGVALVGDVAKRADWTGVGAVTEQANANFSQNPLGTRVQNGEQWGFDLTQEVYEYYGGTGGPAYGIIAVDPDSIENSP